MKYLYNPPLIVKKLFGGFQWETGNEKILLTFDDGPNPDTTGKILKELNNLNLKAIFFCVGNNIKNNSSLTEEIISEGHAIGNHTFNHQILTQIHRSIANVEIDAVNNLMKEIHNYDVKYFRPPHGRFGFGIQKMLQKKNLKSIMWSLLTYDYKNDIKLVKFALQNYLLNNSIVVLHDSDKSKDIIIDSINFIVSEASAKGFEFGEPAGCLK